MLASFLADDENQNPTQKQKLGAIKLVQYQIQKWVWISRSLPWHSLWFSPGSRGFESRHPVLLTAVLSVLSLGGMACFKISKKWCCSKRFHEMYVFHEITWNVGNVSVWESADFTQGKRGKGTSWPWEILIILLWEPSNENRNRASFQQKPYN